MKLFLLLPAVSFCRTAQLDCNEKVNVDGELIKGCQESSFVPPSKSGLIKKALNQKYKG